MSATATPFTARSVRPEPRDFDFRHPSTLSRDDARILQVLQETLAHGIGATLASAVRASIDVKIVAIEQTPHAEVIRRTPNPSALVLLRLDPVAPLALMQIDTELSFSLIELMLGGPGTGPHPERAHTDMEERLLRELIDRFVLTVDEAFAPVAPVSTSVVGQESNATFVQIAPMTEMVVRISLDIGVDEMRGTLNLFIPVASLRPYLDALTSDSADAPRAAAELQMAREQLTEHLAAVDVEAIARFDPFLASSSQLLGLRVGDVIAFDHQLDMPLVLEVDGVPLHDVAIGRVRRSLAVEVMGAAPERPRRLPRMTVLPD